MRGGVWGQITGDNVLIARETARTLGMGTNILTTEGLPEMGPNGEVPKDLGNKYGKWVLEADGFAQVLLHPLHVTCFASA